MTLEQALSHFGGGLNLAKAMTEAGYPITHQAVYKWRRVPKNRQRQIEDITGGRLVADV